MQTYDHSGAGRIRRRVLALGAAAALGLAFSACGDDTDADRRDAGALVDARAEVSEDVPGEVSQDAAADAPSVDADAATDVFPDPPDGACANYDPLRQAFFGDLHVHTGLSLDASLQGTRLMPADAYRFARGESVGIQPHDAEGRPLRTIQLARPLDFAAVTDHAEFLGLITACTSPDAPEYESPECVQYRDDPNQAFVLLNALTAAPQHNVAWPRLCGADGEVCVPYARSAWQRIRDAAADALDTSDECGFTTFIGYEWSGGPGTENLHRNVIFRGDAVPDTAASYFDEPYAEGLWDALDRDCLNAGTGCDVLAIPHNSNLSNGRMFATVDRNGDPFDAEYATRRLRMEPLFEMFQHKGDSECLPGTTIADELCGFEKMPYNSLATANLDIDVRQNPADFVRAAMGVGLQLSQTLGVNPFEYGFIASTDTHLAAPGLVSETSFPGHGGAGQGNRDELPVGLPDSLAFNPGGLAGVWAEENSRESIFTALRRRETFGTSGPRIAVRFFGGWDYATDLCADPDLVRVGYARGVPMGATLPTPPSGTATPRFILSALGDPGAAAVGAAPAEPATPLQRIQIVKGWLDADGEYEVEVFDIAGDATIGTEPGVDLTTCEPMDEGAASLCGVWEDPDFDPLQPAYYYARVIENPTCRWSTRQCAAAGIDCTEPREVPLDWRSCCDDCFERVIQERAWSSPIWYQPGRP